MPSCRPLRPAALVACLLLALTPAVASDSLPDLPSPLAAAVGVDTLEVVAFPLPNGAIALDVPRGMAFVAAGPYVVAVSYISSAQPSPLGWVDVGATVNAVEVASSSTLVAVTPSGLKTIDISDPATMAIRGTVPSASGRRVAVTATRAFVAAGASGVHVVDIANPALPSKQATFLTTDYAYDVSYGGAQYLYIASGSAGVQVIDVSVATMPLIVGSYNTPGSAHGIAYASGLAYVADCGSGLQVLDVAQPVAITLVGSYATAGACAEAVSYSTAEVALTIPGSSRIDLVSVSNPSSPLLRTSIGSVVSAQVRYDDFRVQMLAGSTTGALLVWSGTGTPRPELGRYVGFSSPGTLAVAGRTVYTIEAGALRGFALHSGGRPRPRPAPTAGLVSALAGWGRNLYVGLEGGDVAAFDVGDPLAPLLLSTVDTSYEVSKLATAPPRLYGLDSSRALAFSIAAPSTPATLGDVARGGFGAAQLLGLGNHALVVDFWAGVEAIDFRDPASPSTSSTFQSSSPLMRAALSGSSLFLVDFDKNVRRVDYSDPTNPLHQATGAALSGTGSGIAAAGALAYVDGTTGNSVDVYNIANPYALTKILSQPLPGSWSVMTTAEGYAVVGGTGGIWKLGVAGACRDAYEPNDSRGESKPLDAGSLQRASLCSSTDVDVHALPTSGSGTVRVTMTPPGGHNYDLVLEDSAGRYLAGSIAAGDASETVSALVPAGSMVFAKVVAAGGEVGSSTADYQLIYDFTPCSAPAYAVYLPTLTRDVQNNVVLHVWDPNQPTTRTGYNIYRSATAQGPFTQLATNVVDMDAGTANTQWVDVGTGGGAIQYYRVTATNGACGTEGP